MKTARLTRRTTFSKLTTVKHTKKEQEKMSSDKVKAICNVTDSRTSDHKSGKIVKYM